MEKELIDFLNGSICEAKNNEGIGKADLLLWASKVTDLNATGWSSLHNGGVILKILQSLWPTIADFADISLREKDDYWPLVTDSFERIGIPLSLLDIVSIKRGKGRQCYNLLVALFFMHSLITINCTTIEFALPVDEEVVDFLKSQECLEIVMKSRQSIATATGLTTNLTTLSTTNQTTCLSTISCMIEDEITRQLGALKADAVNKARVQQTITEDLNTANKESNKNVMLKQINKNESKQDEPVIRMSQESDVTKNNIINDNSRNVDINSKEINNDDNTKSEVESKDKVNNDNKINNINYDSEQELAFAADEVVRPKKQEVTVVQHVCSLSRSGSTRKVEGYSQIKMCTSLKRSFSRMFMDSTADLTSIPGQEKEKKEPISASTRMRIIFDRDNDSMKKDSTFEVSSESIDLDQYNQEADEIDVLNTEPRIDSDVGKQTNTIATSDKSASSTNNNISPDSENDNSCKEEDQQTSNNEEPEQPLDYCENTETVQPESIAEKQIQSAEIDLYLSDKLEANSKATNESHKDLTKRKEDIQNVSDISACTKEQSTLSVPLGLLDSIDQEQQTVDVPHQNRQEIIAAFENEFEGRNSESESNLKRNDPVPPLEETLNRNTQSQKSDALRIPNGLTGTIRYKEVPRAIVNENIALQTEVNALKEENKALKDEIQCLQRTHTDRISSLAKEQKSAVRALGVELAKDVTCSTLETVLAKYNISDAVIDECKQYALAYLEK